ncbi:MAG: M15 family metallopeptidase [Spirochaetales bacterium]|nr:M15 family metallopeptidase [Spirochaetales bacterium]
MSVWKKAAIWIILMINACMVCCKKDERLVRLNAVLDRLVLTDEIKADIRTNPKEFLTDLDEVLAADTDDLLILVDKKHLLPSTYAPTDLVPVENTSYMKTNRPGHSLRKPVYEGLKTMCKAAKADGYTMLISSTYRSYQYQDGLYKRYIKIYGEEATAKFSAKPGTSQHQLGVVIDFGNVEDSFAETDESKWLEENAEKYGFALSFPKGYKDVTGFKWECCQYRYIGLQAIALQRKWFGDINQYLNEFVDMWSKTDNVQ